MLQHDIEVAGHIWILAEKAHCELDDHPNRLARLLKSVRADAWVVISPSRSILSWFSEQSLPAIAFGGATTEFPLAGAGVNIVPPVREAVQRLTSLGHRRIVLIAPPHWRQPTPSRTLQAYFDELTVQGITPSEYHAPDWEQSASGLNRLLESLFRVTPPTALLVVEPVVFSESTSIARTPGGLPYLSGPGSHVPLVSTGHCAPPLRPAIAGTSNRQLGRFHSPGKTGPVLPTVPCGVLRGRIDRPSAGHIIVPTLSTHGLIRAPTTASSDSRSTSGSLAAQAIPRRTRSRYRGSSKVHV
jgi:hypothetical protein